MNTSNDRQQNRHVRPHFRLLGRGLLGCRDGYRLI